MNLFNLLYLYQIRKSYGNFFNQVSKYKLPKKQMVVRRIHLKLKYSNNFLKIGMKRLTVLKLTNISHKNLIKYFLLLWIHKSRIKKNKLYNFFICLLFSDFKGHFLHFYYILISLINLAYYVMLDSNNAYLIRKQYLISLSK